MRRESSFNILGRFFGLLILQSILSTVIDFGPLLFVAIYPLFLLTLPFNFSRNILMVLAFVMGLLVDYLSNSIMGISSAASLIMVLFYPRILKLILPKGEMEGERRVTLRSLGVESYLLFILSNLLIHHLALILIENGGFSLFLYNTPRLLISLTFNTMVIFVIEYGFFYRDSTQ